MDIVYNNAVNTIRDFAQKKLFELEQEYSKNRAEHVNKFMEEIFDGVDKNSPVYSLATLVAQTTTIGRDDGYPRYNLDSKVTKVLQAAAKAGILFHEKDGYTYIGKIGFYHDFSGISVYSKARENDYKSWDTLVDYRNKQTWNKL